jgi:hypothetical protein
MSAWLETVRRKRLAVMGAGVGLLLAVCVLFSLFVPHGDLIVETIRKQGYPASLAELDAWYPSVPPAENAALVYTNAFALLTNLSGPNTSFTSALPPIGQGLSADEESELKDVLADNQAALRLIYSAPASGHSRYPVCLGDGYNVMLLHLAKTKQAVTLLSAEGLMRASHDDAEKAAQAFLVAGRVAESLGDEPTVISQLRRYADWAILLPRLERALSLTTFTDSQLTSLQKMLEAAERPQAMARAMAFARVCGLNAMTDRKAMGMGLQKRGWNRQLAEFWIWAAVGLFRATGMQGKDKAFYADTMARHIAALELPYPARAAAGTQAAALTNAPNRFCVFSQSLLPAMVVVHGRDANHVAKVRLATVALGIERFRLAHTNALPESLKGLAPSFCATVPTDPFGGEPLRYKTHGASYAVYSIGSDGQDDGGVAWDSNYTKVPQDVSFVVKH